MTKLISFIILLIIILPFALADDNLDRCGDNICNTDETYFNCPNDCSFEYPEIIYARSTCGNNICEDSENYRNCHTDCLSPKTVELKRKQIVFNSVIIVSILLIFGTLVYFIIKETGSKNIAYKRSLYSIENRQTDEVIKKQETFASLSQKLNSELSEKELLDKMKKTKSFQEFIKK